MLKNNTNEIILPYLEHQIIDTIFTNESNRKYKKKTNVKAEKTHYGDLSLFHHFSSAREESKLKHTYTVCVNVCVSGVSVGLYVPCEYIIHILDISLNIHMMFHNVFVSLQTNIRSSHYPYRNMCKFAISCFIYGSCIIHVYM